MKLIQQIFILLLLAILICLCFGCKKSNPVESSPPSVNLFSLPTTVGTVASQSGYWSDSVTISVGRWSTVRADFRLLQVTAIPTAGLVAYYPFNGNANDESGNGNNGYINGAVLTQDRFGNSNRAFTFNGTRSVIQVSHNPNFNMGNLYSISVWFKLSDVTLPRSIIVKNLGVTGYTDYFNLTVVQSIGILSGRIGNGTANTGALSANPVNDSYWHHAVFTLSDSLRLWIDGQLSGKAFRDISALQNTDPVLIGYWQSNTPFLGQIDDIRIYNRALSASEVQSLYHEGGW